MSLQMAVVIILVVFLALIEEGSCQRKKANSSSSTVRKGGLQLGAGNKRNSTIALGFDKKTLPMTEIPPLIPDEDDLLILKKKEPEVPVVSVGSGGSGVVYGKGGRMREKVKLNVGLLVPYSMFHQRDYLRAVSNAISMLQRKDSGREFYQRYKFTSDEIKMFMISVSPSPRGEKCSNYLFVLIIWY